MRIKDSISIIISLFAVLIAASSLYFQFLHTETKINVWIGNYENTGKQTKFDLVFINSGNTHQNVSKVSISDGAGGLVLIKELNQFPLVMSPKEMTSIKTEYNSPIFNNKKEKNKRKYIITFKVLDTEGKEYITSFELFNYSKTAVGSYTFNAKEGLVNLNNTGRDGAINVAESMVYNYSTTTK
jgi:hypothetical protein